MFLTSAKMSWVGTYEENRFYQPQLLHSMYKSLPSNRRIYTDMEKGSNDCTNTPVGDEGEIKYSLGPSKYFSTKM